MECCLAQKAMQDGVSLGRNDGRLACCCVQWPALSSRPQPFTAQGAPRPAFYRASGWAHPLRGCSKQSADRTLGAVWLHLQPNWLDLCWMHPKLRKACGCPRRKSWPARGRSDHIELKAESLTSRCRQALEAQLPRYQAELPKLCAEFRLRAGCTTPPRSGQPLKPAPKAYKNGKQSSMRGDGCGAPLVDWHCHLRAGRHYPYRLGTSTDQQFRAWPPWRGWLWPHKTLAPGQRGPAVHTSERLAQPFQMRYR